MWCRMNLCWIPLEYRYVSEIAASRRRIGLYHPSHRLFLTLNGCLPLLVYQVNGLEELNDSSPFKFGELDLLLTIAKTARVARFIRSMTAVKLSSKVNWYGILNLVNPMWYVQKFCPSRTLTAFEIEEAKAKAEAKKKKEGHVGMLALAAVKAGGSDRDVVGRRMHLWDIGIGVLRMIGIGRQSNEEFRRHLAATKIQRAWRNVLEQNKMAIEKDAQAV
jgi:hypothetical protein